MRSVSSLEVCCGQRRQSARDTNSLQPLVNPFTPSNDQHRISPNNVNTISRRQVMRIKKNIY